MSVTVCLSFDIDAYAAVLFRGEQGVATPSWEQNAATLSCAEFDTQIAVPRLLGLLRDYQINATFFIPGHTADCFPKMVETVLEAGHEIAHHGYLHEPPNQLSPDQEMEILSKGTESLKRLTGTAPRGYRAPLWEPSPRTLGLLAENGFEFDSSLMGTDFIPYHPRRGDNITADGVTFGSETGIVELPSSWVFDDWSYFGNVRRAGGGGATPPSHVFEIWSEQVSFAAECVPDGVVVMTMHPQVSGQGYVLRMLRQFLDKLTKDDRVSFDNMGKAAHAWRRSKRGEG